MEPKQLVEWLGFRVDLELGKISIPNDKIMAVRQSIANLLLNPAQPRLARSIASLVGKLISFTLAVGPIARLRTRALYRVIESRVTWKSCVVLSEEAKGELKFWFDNLEFLNGQNIWRSPSAVRVVYSDASDTGFAGYLVEHGMHVAHGLWTLEESKLSSTWRELKAVALVLESIAPKLARSSVRWFTDNQNVVRIISVGSTKEHLQACSRSENF